MKIPSFHCECRTFPPEKHVIHTKKTFYFLSSCFFLSLQKNSPSTLFQVKIFLHKMAIEIPCKFSFMSFHNSLGPKKTLHTTTALKKKYLIHKKSSICGKGESHNIHFLFLSSVVTPVKPFSYLPCTYFSIWYTLLFIMVLCPQEVCAENTFGVRWMNRKHWVSKAHEQLLLVSAQAPTPTSSRLLNNFSLRKGGQREREREFSTISPSDFPPENLLSSELSTFSASK